MVELTPRIFQSALDQKAEHIKLVMTTINEDGQAICVRSHACWGCHKKPELLIINHMNPALALWGCKEPSTDFLLKTDVQLSNIIINSHEISQNV